MTQVTGYSTAAAKVEYSTNGSSWTDISGAAVKVTTPSQDRSTGSVNTHDVDAPIVTFGKRSPVSPKFTVVYSEGTGDPFEVLRAAFEAGTSCYLRWSPRGGGAGQFQFATAVGVITQFNYPQTDATSGDPIVCEFTHTSAGITKSAVAT